MSCSDKFLPKRGPAARRIFMQRAMLLVMIAPFAGCDRMVASRDSQALKDADRKTTNGDFLEAISLYEAALDGTASSAETHYRMALLYDDKMNDPLNALHHFKRYLTLAPGGSHASEAKDFMKRDELALMTSLSGDAVVPRTEATRLRNENLSLRKELDDRAALARTAAAADKGPTRGTRAQKSPSPTPRRKARPISR